jgi:hypothetical protein
MQYETSVNFAGLHGVTFRMIALFKNVQSNLEVRLPNLRIFRLMIPLN